MVGLERNGFTRGLRGFQGIAECERGVADAVQRPAPEHDESGPLLLHPHAFRPGKEHAAGDRSGGRGGRVGLLRVALRERAFRTLDGIPRFFDVDRCPGR